MTNHAHETDRMTLPFVGISTFGKRPYIGDCSAIQADVVIMGAARSMSCKSTRIWILSVRPVRKLGGQRFDPYSHRRTALGYHQIRRLLPLDRARYRIMIAAASPPF